MASAGQQARSRPPRKGTLPLDSRQLVFVPECLPFIPHDAAIYNLEFGFQPTSKCKDITCSIF